MKRGVAQPAASLAVAIRRHAEARIGALVDTAGGAEAGVINRTGNVIRLLERSFQGFQAAGFLVLFGREPHNRLECALQVKPAQAGLRRELFQGERLSGVFLDIPAEFLNARRLRAGAFKRPASQACPQAIALRRLGRGIEPDVLLQRTPRGTGWFAIHPGGEHPDIEDSIEAVVALTDGFPAFVGIDHASSVAHLNFAVYPIVAREFCI